MGTLIRTFNGIYTLVNSFIFILNPLLLRFVFSDLSYHINLLLNFLSEN